MSAPMMRETPDVLRLIRKGEVEDAREKMVAEFADWLIDEGLYPSTPMEVLLDPDATPTQRHWTLQFVRRWADYAERISL